MSFRLLFLATVALLVAYTGLCLHRVAPSHETLTVAVTLFIPVFVIGVQILIRKNKLNAEWLPSRLLVWAGSVGFGYWASFTLFFALADLLNLGAMIVSAFFPASIETVLAIHSHRLEIARTLMIVALITTLLGFLETLLGPRVKRRRIPVTALPAALEGLTIAQLSDLHIGQTIRRDYIERTVTRTMALGADIIAVTGDIADGLPADLREQSQPLSKLHAPLGVYYITGNHEYYSGALAWIDEATRLGFIPLVNENRVVGYKGESVLVAGVTDISSHHFIPAHRSDPVKAAETATACAFRLLLAHQPESCYVAAAAGFHLQLSGHTHGGQFFPFSLLVRLFKRFPAGLFRVRGMAVYVNAGTGFWGVANRFLVPAEITLLEIVAG